MVSNNKYQSMKRVTCSLYLNRRQPMVNKELNLYKPTRFFSNVFIERLQQNDLRGYSGECADGAVAEASCGL